MLPLKSKDLVTSAHVLRGTVQMHTLGNVHGLLLNGHQHVAGVAVETYTIKHLSQENV